jgi:hypothetical protein
MKYENFMKWWAIFRGDFKQEIQYVRAKLGT